MKKSEWAPGVLEQFHEKALSAYDFARCQRPDGTYYGTGGQCRKGIEVGAREKETKGPSRSSLPEYWQGRADMSESKYDNKVDKMGSHLVGMQNVSPEWETAVANKKAIYNKLSSDEKAAVQMYGAAGPKEEIYGDLNMKLRTGKEPPSEKKDAINFVDSNLRSGLAKLPDQEGTFYRAVSGGGAQALANVKVGDTIQDNGFGSYSDRGGPKIAPFISSESQNIVMVVQGKTLKNVSPVMPYQEGEHLSQPGINLRLVDIQPAGYYSRKVGDVPTYVFEEV